MRKKGLSTVVTSLILILLVLVAVGIIWQVIRAFVEETTEDIDISAKCLSIDVRATAVELNTGETYDITLTRKAGGEEEIGGVKAVFFNDSDNSAIIDIEGTIAELQTVTKTSGDTGINSANKVDVTVYFKVDGEDKLCTITNPFSF
jgi:hypothetical protein